MVKRFNPGSSDYTIANGLLRFDTSSLPNDAIITSAALRLYLTNIQNGNARSLTADYHDWNGTSADVTATEGTDAISGIALDTGWGAGQHDFPLTGLSGINPEGDTSSRLHISGGVPTLENLLGFASLEETGLAGPQLIVTYTMPTETLCLSRP